MIVIDSAGSAHQNPQMASTAGEPTYEIADLFPRQGYWTEADYLLFSRDLKHLVELNEGFLEVLVMPTEEHQLVLGRLADLFRALTQTIGGLALFAPLRFQVGPGRFREPDLMVLRSAGDSRRRNAFWLGADLVVEILSPDDPQRDTVTKRGEYAQARVPEYWIVDPQGRTILVLRLAGAEYVEDGLYSGSAVVRSRVFPEVVCTAADIFVDLR